MRRYFYIFRDDIIDWTVGWYRYIERKFRSFGVRFEANKSVLVKMLMARRGTYQRPFLHFSLSVLVALGVLSAPILADSYPGAIPDELGEYESPSTTLSTLDFSEYGVETQVSEKPRDQIIEYKVTEGDTLGSIAEKFGVSIDTLRWANDIKGDRLSIGKTIKIPPVTGIVHKVKEGDTVYSVAKKYKASAQNIVNFPFNDFIDLDTFALRAGQTLIVPDGVVPQAPAIIRKQAIPSVIASGTGQFLWPAGGSITQYPIWYHMAIDIANRSAPGIAAADSGTVIVVQYLRYAYGYHVIIDHGNGYQTLYAHLSEIYVTPGDNVARGQIIGRMGSTGRSTGTHLHFEIREGGRPINPLPFLQ